MKKFLLIVLIIVLVIGAGFAGYLLFDHFVAKQLTLEKVLPAGAVVYVKVSDAGQNIETLMQTKFWQRIKAIDYKRSLEILKAQKENVAALEKITQEMSSPEARQVLDKFFGREFALAIYPTAAESSPVSPLQGILSQGVFVTRLKTQAQLTEFLISYLNVSSDKIKMREETYNAHTVQVINIENVPFEVSYARIKNILVFGVGQAAVRRSLDVFDGKSAALAADPVFNKARAGLLSGADVIGIMDFQRVMSSFKQQIIDLALRRQEPSKLDEARQQIDESFRQTQGVKSLVYSSRFDKVSEAKFVVFYDQNELAEEMRPLYDCSPQQNASLKFIPQGVLGYQWSGCYDFAYYWEQLKNEARKDGGEDGGDMAVEAMVAGIEQKLQLSIEDDLLPSFGKEIGGYLQDVEVGGFFPVPKIVLFVKVNDKDKVSDLIDQLLARQPLFMPNTSIYQGETISYIKVPIVAGITPGYCLLNDYLLVATNEQLLKDSIDTVKGKKESLAASALLQQVDPDFSKPSNSALFLNIGSLLQKGPALVDWASQWLLMQKAKQQAFRSGTQKRLDDVRLELAKTEAQLKALKEQPEVAEPLMTPEGRQAKIADLENQIKTDKATADDLNAILMTYDEQEDLSGEEQKEVADILVKPLLEAFAYLNAVSSRVIFGEGMLESLLRWQLL